MYTNVYNPSQRQSDFTRPGKFNQRVNNYTQLYTAVYNFIRLYTTVRSAKAILPGRVNSTNVYTIINNYIQFYAQRQSDFTWPGKFNQRVHNYTQLYTILYICIRLYITVRSAKTILPGRVNSTNVYTIIYNCIQTYTIVHDCIRSTFIFREPQT